MTNRIEVLNLDVGGAVRDMRLAAGLSQAALADKPAPGARRRKRRHARLTVPMISDIERGYSPPRLADLAAIAAKTGFQMKIVFTRVGGQ